MKTVRYVLDIYIYIYIIHILLLMCGCGRGCSGRSTHGRGTSRIESTTADRLSQWRAASARDRKGEKRERFTSLAYVDPPISSRYLQPESVKFNFNLLK